jgi:TPR repeat protein
MKIPPLRGGDFQAVGLAYYNGQGVPKDYAEVAKWYRKAAEQGAMDAQYNLAQLYLFGEGVTQDNAEAAKWWRIAADQGYGAVPNLILASRITMATVCLRMRLKPRNGFVKVPNKVMHRLSLSLEDHTAQVVAFLKTKLKQSNGHGAFVPHKILSSHPASALRIP